MDLQISGRKAVILSDDANLATACANALEAEGVEIATLSPLPDDGTTVVEFVAANQPDIVILAPAFSEAALDETVDDCMSDIMASHWERVVTMAAGYRAALPYMTSRSWGRLIAIGTVDAKEMTSRDGDLERISGLGVLGLSRSVAGELGETGITSNCVLRDPSMPVDASHRGVAGAVTFLCSVGAAYVTGSAIAVDDGRSAGVF